MRIERKFYTEGKKLQLRILQEVEREQAKLTKQERTAEYTRLRKESDRLYALYLESTQQNVQKQRAIQEKKFLKLVEKALRLAEICCLDILAETFENDRGVIRLEAEYFALLENADPILREDWVELCKNAYEMMISHKIETFVIELWYSLQREFIV